MTQAPSSPKPDEQRQVRLDKLSAIREAGFLAYSDRFERSHLLTDVHAVAEKQAEPDSGGTPVTVAGRVMTVRTFGKLVFLHLQDSSGKCQIVLDGRRMDAAHIDQFRKLVDLGDHVGVAGETGRTKKGEPSVFASSWTFLSKAIRPLPEKFHGLVDGETRQRHRYLDLVTNPETRARFRFRSRFIRELRRFLDDHDFEEVDTPILQTKPSGALARPFFTHHNALDMQCALRIAPETWLKQCIVGGFDRVYEVARCFRNEGMDPSHLQDFTMCEWYAAYWDYRDNMDFTERLLLHLLDTLHGSRELEIGGQKVDFSPPWPRVSFRELIQQDANFDYEEYPDAASLRAAIRERGIELERDDLDGLGRGTLIDLLYKKVSRPALVNPTFVTGHPIDLSPLARRSDEFPTITDRYQLVVNGWEIVNAYSELVDPVDQRERFEAQAAAKQAGDDEALEVDEDYLRAMEHGMPPMSGWGMGIERVVALLTGQDNLREVVLFPLMKPLDGSAESGAAKDGPAASSGGGDAGSASAGSVTEETMSQEHRALLGTPADDCEDCGITPEAAKALFDEWVETPSLRRQMLQASCVMAAFARHLGKTEQSWRLIGLLHNLDYDRVKEAERHCIVAAEALREAGMHPSAIHAIAAHNDDGLAFTGIRCISVMDHALSACEAVVGLIHACAQVLPTKDVADLKPKSVKKRFKNLKFAANVERPLIERCAGAGLELEAFLELALEALQQDRSWDESASE